MQRTFDYSYLPCQFCVGKNHCEQCGEEIRRALEAVRGVTRVTMDAPARRLTIDFDGADMGDIEERAEAMGVFL